MHLDIGLIEGVVIDPNKKVGVGYRLELLIDKKYRSRDSRCTISIPYL